MRAKEVIPLKKELLFIVKLILVILVSLVISFIILFAFFNQNLGDSYIGAYQIISSVFEKLNTIIILAVFFQLAFSLILIYFIALFFSHKMAGPMYRVKVLFKQYLQGTTIENISFRRTDFLSGVRGRLNRFLNFISHKEKMLTEAEFLRSQLASQDEETRAVSKKKIEALIRELESCDED